MQEVTGKFWIECADDIISQAKRRNDEIITALDRDVKDLKIECNKLNQNITVSNILKSSCA